MKLALVTGGSLRMGATIAARLATEGFDLAIQSRKKDQELDPALAACVRATGRTLEWFSADFADPADVEALLPAVTARFGRAPDCLINNAAAFGQDNWHSLDNQTLMSHLQVNTAAPVVLAAGLARIMPQNGRAVVINILDQRIRNPPLDQASYTASKLCLAALTGVMAHALAPNVRVNAVAPGLTIPTADYNEAQLRRLRSAMPLDHLASPEEVAEAVAYLIGADSVTGQTLYVDAGASHRAFPRDFMFMNVNE